MQESYRSTLATKGLKGTVTVPGDKSVSHRSLIFASIASGRSTIEGMLEGEDVLCTAAALRQMGVSIEKNAKTGQWIVDGVGIGGLSEPSGCLDMGNSGTAARLMMGLVSSYGFNSFFTGDASLCKRPMNRVIQPLSEMGVAFVSRSQGRLPLVVQGSDEAMPIRYCLPVASAQVKSAILLAGLNIRGTTTVIEPEATRDHTERMIRFMGGDISVEQGDANERIIRVNGQSMLKAADFKVPADPSSAAFPVVAALLTPGSDMVIKGICTNPERIGLYQTLQEMGGHITFINARQEAGEEVVDVQVRHSTLQGIEIPASRAPSMIDEYPIVSVAASMAKGTTTMLGLEELRVKESDRLSAVEQGLLANGVTVKTTKDSMSIEGNPDSIEGGGVVTTHMDHRIAMAFLVMGMVAKNPVTIDDGSFIKTSFPEFISLMNSLGAAIVAAK